MTKLERVERLIEKVAGTNLPEGSTVMPDTKEWLCSRLEALKDMAFEEDNGYSDNGIDALLQNWELYITQHTSKVVGDATETPANKTTLNATKEGTPVNKPDKGADVMEQKRKTASEIRRDQITEAAKKGLQDEMTLKFKIKTDASQLLNNLLIGRKKQTKLQFEQPVVFFDKSKEYAPSVKKIKNSENRGYRFHKGILVTDERVIPVKMTNGEVWEAHAEYTYLAFDKKKPVIVFAEFIGMPMSSMASKAEVDAFMKSQKMIIEGLTYNTAHYEYAFSSSAQQRTLKGVFIPDDYEIPKEYLDMFDLSIPGCKEYVDMIREFRGAEAVYEVMTYGGYSLIFRGKLGSCAKFGARIGTCHTSSKALGRIRVKHMGEVHVLWTPELEAATRKYYAGLMENGKPIFTEAAVDKIVAKIEKTWKTQKLDGQSIIADDAVVEGFRLMDVKLTSEDVVGRLIQLRYAGVKGTALCLPRWIFEMVTLPDGSHPYSDYDMIVEHSSWKYDYRSEFYTGELAPELELVNVSKARYSNNLNYQFIQALDGDNNRLIKTKEKLRELIDTKFTMAQYAMENPEFMKAFLGIMSRDESEIDGLDMDDYSATLVTALAAALDADERIIKDKSWRLKFVSRLTKQRDKMGYGKIPVDGANRYIISDPIAMLRTDLAVPRLKKDGSPAYDHEGNPMYDIVITDPSQVAISGIFDAHWANNEKPAVLFRSPCVHPGEPQLVDLIGLDKIPETIETAYGTLPVRELFVAMKDIVVVNIFSNILDTLGGADTDGDTVLVVTEPIVVMLRNKRRLPMLTSTGGDTVEVEINPKSMKEYMANSLKDAGVGRITNWATTWRDIESMVIHMPNPDGKYRLPVNVCTDIYKCANEARKALKDMRESMSEDEIAACEALSKIGPNGVDLDGNPRIRLNVDESYQAWSRAVILVCEKALNVLRRLQEMAIETAKSGKFVEFDNYKYLKLKVRATWHRTISYNRDLNYDSWSVMGDVDSYAEKRWKQLQDWAIETSAPISVGNGLDIASYKDIYETIREFKGSFGNAMFALNDKYRKAAMEGDSFSISEDMEKMRMRDIRDICNHFHILLTQAAIHVGSVDIISMLVYRATYDVDKGRDTKNDGMSFLWLCWGKEFVATLRHYSSGTETSRLVSIFMAPEFKDYVLASADDYIVENGELKHLIGMDLVTLGHVKVPDGTYRVINHDDTSYVVKPVVRQTVESLSASLAGCPVRIIGFRHREFEGNPLDRAMVKELITRSNFIIRTEIDESGRIKDGEFVPATMVYVNVGDDTNENWIRVGNIPEGGGRKDNSGFIGKALHNVKLKVAFGKNCDKTDPETRLMLEIVSIIDSYNE